MKSNKTSRDALSTKNRNDCTPTQEWELNREAVIKWHNAWPGRVRVLRRGNLHLINIRSRTQSAMTSPLHRLLSSLLGCTLNHYFITAVQWLSAKFNHCSMAPPSPPPQPVSPIFKKIPHTKANFFLFSFMRPSLAALYFLDLFNKESERIICYFIAFLLKYHRYCAT